jgi:hypothetical protein
LAHRTYVVTALRFPRGDHLGGGEVVTGDSIGRDSLTSGFAQLDRRTSCGSSGLWENFCSQFAPTQCTGPADEDRLPAR